MNIEEIALRLIESDCSVDIYFGILDKLEKHTTKIQELEKEKAHIEIAYEEDYKEQQQEIERLNNIINEIEKELDLNLPFKVIGVRGLKNKIKELKEDK